MSRNEYDTFALSMVNGMTLNHKACSKYVCKRLCNEKIANCTCLVQVIDIRYFVSMCGCAAAHACTCAHTALKPLILLVRAAVRMCISIENYRERCINTLSFFRDRSLYRRILIGY